MSETIALLLEVPKADSGDAVLLLSRFQKLGPNGRETLLFIAERLVVGNAKYGDFSDDDTRDYKTERAEEYADATVYATREVLRARRDAQR